MSLINSLLTELEARHSQNAPARPPPADLQHLQAVQPDEDATRRRRWILLITAMISTLAAAWVVLLPTLHVNWRFWEKSSGVEVVREELATTPSVQLLADNPSPPEVFPSLGAPPEANVVIPEIVTPASDDTVRSPTSPVEQKAVIASATPSLPNLTVAPPKPEQDTPVARAPSTLAPEKPATRPEKRASILSAETTIAPENNPKFPESAAPTPPKQVAIQEDNKPEANTAKKMASTPTHSENSVKPPPSAQSGVNQEMLAQQSYRDAKIAVKKGFLADAERQLRDTLNADPKHVGARGTLAGLYIEQGRWMEAEHILNEGLKLNPQELSFIRWQSRVLIEQGAEKQALQLMEEAPEASLNDADFCGFLATLYNRANNLEKAVPMYRKALGLKPTEGRWWVGLASVYERKQNYPAAIDAYARGVTDNHLETSLANYARDRIANLRTRLNH